MSISNNVCRDECKQREKKVLMAFRMQNLSENRWPGQENKILVCVYIKDGIGYLCRIAHDTSKYRVLLKLTQHKGILVVEGVC
jgi:hypothetical protein